MHVFIMYAHECIHLFDCCFPLPSLLSHPTLSLFILLSLSSHLSCPSPPPLSLSLSLLSP